MKKIAVSTKTAASSRQLYDAMQAAKAGERFSGGYTKVNDTTYISVGHAGNKVLIGTFNGPGLNSNVWVDGNTLQDIMKYVNL